MCSDVFWDLTSNKTSSFSWHIFAYVMAHFLDAKCLLMFIMLGTSVVLIIVLFPAVLLLVSDCWL